MWACQAVQAEDAGRVRLQRREHNGRLVSQAQAAVECEGLKVPVMVRRRGCNPQYAAHRHQATQHQQQHAPNAHAATVIASSAKRQPAPLSCSTLYIPVTTVFDC